MTDDIYDSGVEMRSGLNISDSSSANISAFSLFVMTNELCGRRNGDGMSLNRKIDFFLRHRDSFLKERFSM
jgi:hypothetical protein